MTHHGQAGGMDKVSIGLRGWRFDEDAVLTEDGDLKAYGEMDPDVRERVLRLDRLVEAPCDACWLIHGDANVQQCRVATVVYGEPFEEVVLCDEHEPDFLYWFHECGGVELAGTDEFEDGFHEWFLDGGRAPEGYGGLDHVDVAPEEIPEFDRDGSGDEETDRTDDDPSDDLDLGMDYPTRD